MNETLTAPHLLRPLWLLGLLLAPLVWRWLRHPPQPQARWREAVDPHLLPHLLQGEPPRSGRLRAWLGVTALVLAVVALSGPSWREQAQPLWRNRSPLVIAVDLSAAMTQQDVPPSRLVRARAKIADILRGRSGGQIGLIAFTDDAYTVSPLTDDVANIRLYLDALSPQVMPRDGHDPGRAVEQAAQLLRGAGFEAGDILLITDAVDTDAISAAAAARADGYRVSALGVGGTMDIATLRALALAGGGRATGLTLDDADLRTLGTLVAARIDGAAQQGRRGLAAFDEGYWLLPPLLLLMALAFRRGVLFALLVCLSLPMQDARAQTPAPASAQKEVDGTLWRRADQARHARMQAGVEAYRAGRYREAEAAWRALPGADAAYNRGNALARQGRYDEAIAEYDRALREAPTMRDAIENRRVVEQARRRASPPPPRDRSGEPQQRGSGGDKPQTASSAPRQKPSDPSSGKPSGSSAGQPQPATPPGTAQRMTPAKSATPGTASSGQARSQQATSQQATSEPAGSAPGKPADPAHAAGKADPGALAGMSAEARAAREAAQRAADAAQRARMDRALAKAKQGKADGATPVARTPAERAARQRDLQLDAELRRVADDPGGLLRAKFLLEDRRRGRDR